MKQGLSGHCCFTCLVLIFSSMGWPQSGPPSNVLGDRQSQGLPDPSGKYHIGRQAFDWVDSTRLDSFPSASQKYRELMVYIWYPAQEPSLRMPSAEYFPFAREVEKDPTAKRAAQDLFGERWPQIVAGSIRSHAVTDAAPINGEKFPVILFSHGYSSTTFSYTAQIEDLVSHGYIVVAIEHTDASGLVRFADGRMRPFRDLPPPSSAPKDPLQAMIASAERSNQIGAEDVRFVLDTLNEKAMSLSNRMDLSKTAAVGHSAGGTLAARACQIDSRIKACISEEGEVNPVGAFFDYSDHTIMKQPFLLIQVESHFTDAELARMRESRAGWNNFLAHERQQLDQCGKGSYFVSLNRPGMGHSSFSDGPALNARDSEQASVALANLQVTEELERAFLDKNLKGAPASLFEQTDRYPSGVKIEPVGQ